VDASLFGLWLFGRFVSVETSERGYTKLAVELRPASGDRPAFVDRLSVSLYDSATGERLVPDLAPGDVIAVRVRPRVVRARDGQPFVVRDAQAVRPVFGDLSGVLGGAA
jgi:hypothetical protein